MDESEEKYEQRCTTYNETLANVIQISEMNKPLRSDQYKAIIEKAKQDASIVYRDAPMMSPEGGTIVVYDCGIVEAWKDLADCEKRKSCRCDGYRWSRMKGAKALSNGLYRCYNFLYDKDCKAGSDVFVRYEFTLCTEPAGLILFHYVGNHEIAREVSASAPHGNARKTMQPYTRTLPATRLDIRRSLLLTGSADKTFKALQEHSCVSGKESIALPRNQEQVRYELNAMQRSMRVSDDNDPLYDHVPMTSLEFQSKLVNRLSTIPADRRGEVRAKLEHELDMLFAQKIAAEIEQVFDESARESVMERLLAMVTP